MPWSARFEDPIALPSGRALVTLRDAAQHIQRLAPAAQRAPHWQFATAILIRAAEGREPLLHARIALLRAINHGRPEPPPAPRRKKAKVYRIISATNR